VEKKAGGARKNYKSLYSKDLISQVEGKKLCWRSMCGWNDIIEMDMIAVVINVKMSSFGWRLEQAEGFCYYGNRLSV
jgi:hypothetical protein